MKLVINVCFGGFSISSAAVRRYAELQGRPCYFFRSSWRRGEDKWTPVLPGENTDDSQVYALDIPNPQEDADYDTHGISSRPRDRSDPLLVQVVEELGEKANGSCAKLRIVEIPDGVQYTIEEYDGREHVAEVHRTWA